MDRGDARAVTARTRIALTIAGSDSGGGAGIQADLKTFAALGVYAASAITALTAQNTRGVSAIHFPPPEIVAAQIAAVLADFDVAAIKIGMLGSAEIVGAVAGSLQGASPLLPLREKVSAEGRRMRGLLRTPPSIPVETRASRRDPSSGLASPGHLPPQGGKGRAPFVIYDPVMIASSGDALAGDGFVEAIKARLLPLVDCLTPNLAEAAALLGAPLAQDEAEMARQGAALLELGPRAALIKGGHLAGAEAVDLLVTGDGVLRFAAPRLISRNLHGTGCTLSSAIAAHIVLGLELAEAIGQAKEFVRAAIGAGSGLKLGGGAGPLIQAGLREGRRFSSPDAFS
jgi:hydroxymethylpyrimidine/phosphomethylpyrimidine kinase